METAATNVRERGMSREAARYSGTPLIRKLGIKPGHAFATLAAPEGFPQLMSDLPADVLWRRDPPIPVSMDEKGARSFDVILAFVLGRSELQERLPSAQRLLAWDGGLWIAWPKASSLLAGDLRGKYVRQHGLAAGLVDNKVCAVDHDWSALQV